MMVKSSPVLGYLFPDSPIFPDTRHKSFAVLLIFKLPDPGNRQHFTLSIWFQNTHMSQCLIRENYIRRHLLLSGDLQAKPSQYLKKLLFCLCKLCTGQMGSSLRMYISDSDNLSQATDCGLITGIHDGSTNSAQCNGTGRFFWIRTIGSKTMNVPEFTVMGLA